jgi:ribonuclease HII
MVLRVGIDEAGYGPVLGPLVVAATVWQVPPALAEESLWKALASAVRRSPNNKDRRLAVWDSKALFDQKTGVGPLERPVLSFARAADMPRESLAALLAALTGDAIPFASPLPWYRDLSASLPRDTVHGKHEAASSSLIAALARANVQCAGLLAQVISEDAYNERLARTGNKAAIVAEQVLRLIDRAVRLRGLCEAHIVVDRLGGRADYRPLLMQAFPERAAEVLEVSDTCSRYRLTAPESTWTLTFVVDADRQHLPVALASMTAKYVRELLMEQFNHWWRGRDPALRPTAGYHGDAQRFLDDITPVLLPGTGLAPERFIRAR